jgi:kynureninase
LKLHDWNVDFAVFCTYKYLNSSAGCIGGIFVHSNHFDKQYPHFDGWWGNRDETRFQMKRGRRLFSFRKSDKLSCIEIDRDIGANGFRISNPSIHQCATLAASLEVNGLSMKNYFL